MRLALGLMLGAMAFGQSFRHLTTTDDGSRLYFSSDGPNSGILVFDGQSARQFAHEDGSLLVLPSVSGDGRVVGFSAIGDLRIEARVALGDGTVVWNYTGQAAVSRNGRFVLFMTLGAEPRATVVDLAGGPAYATLLPQATAVRTIASDGTFATGGPNAIRVVRASGVDTYDAPDTPAEVVIDDGATAVAYVAAGRLMLLDLASGVQTLVADNAADPRFTAGGQSLLYLARDANGARQAWMAGRDIAGARQITSEESGIVEAAVSGDGRTAFAINGASRVLRIDVASGAALDLTRAILETPTEAPRVVSFKVSGGQLCYNVANAKTISIAPGLGSVPPPSACLAVAPAKTTYTLSAANDLGTSTAFAAEEQGPVGILSFKNDPSFSPISGGAVTLSWTTRNAERVNMTGLGAPPGALAANGSVVVRPDTNTTYTLYAYSANGQVVTSVLYVFVR